MSARSNQQRRETLYAGAHIPDTQNGIGEANVVDGRALATRINRFCDVWNADRPSMSGGAWGSPNDKFYGPITWLAEHANIPVRRLSAIRNGYSRHVNMSRADAILQAIGEDDRLEDDLEPYPNPRWSSERWHAYMEERVGGCW